MPMPRGASGRSTSGWNREEDLIRANEDFESHDLERFEITADLADFCAETPPDGGGLLA